MLQHFVLALCVSWEIRSHSLKMMIALQMDKQVFSTWHQSSRLETIKIVSYNQLEFLLQMVVKLHQSGSYTWPHAVKLPLKSFARLCRLLKKKRKKKTWAIPRLGPQQSSLAILTVQIRNNWKEKYSSGQYKAHVTVIIHAPAGSVIIAAVEPKGEWWYELHKYQTASWMQSINYGTVWGTLCPRCTPLRLWE